MPIETPVPTDSISTPTPPQDDLPLAITRAVEAAEKAASPSPETPARPSPVAGETPTPPASKVEGDGAGTQPRGTDGKFAPKPLTPPADGQPAAPTDGAPSTPGSSGEPPPPQSWKPELKERWAKIDPEVRGEILRREQEINHGLQASARRAQAASQVLAEFEPYAEILQSENISPVAAMRDLLGTAYALRSSGPEHRKTIFLQLAQQYGVDLTTGINSAQAQAEAMATAADISMRTQRVSDENAQVDYARNVLTQFAQSPGHEHFPHVAEIMGSLMATGVCGDLETAYQQACALHPQLRPALIRQEAERLAKQQADEAAARAAAASSVGSTPGAGGLSMPTPGAAGGNPDLRSSLEAAFDRATR